MNTIKIINMTPLHGSILLAVIENQSSKKRDVKLLADTHGDIWPPTSETAFIPESLEIAWPDENGVDKNMSDENSVDVTVEIEQEVLGDIQNWCSEMAVSVEQLMIAFLHFCACPENYGAVRKWLVSEKAGNA